MIQLHHKPTHMLAVAEFLNLTKLTVLHHSFQLSDAFSYTFHISSDLYY